MRRLLSVSLIVLAVVHAGASGRDDADPFGFLRPSVTLSPAERHALDRGEPVVALLDTEGPELAVFSATRVASDVTADRALAWMRQVERWRQGRYTLAAGRFSPTPTLDDLDGLVLDEVDLEDIRTCRPGRCGLKLSSSEIVRLQQVAAAPGEDWRRRVQVAFRELVLARVQAFSRGGHAALEAISDRQRPRSSATAFARVLDHSPFLQHAVPGLARHLAARAAAPLPGSESLVYWAKERLGNKAVVSATSLTFVPGDDATGPGALVVGVQVFATHYFDASLAVSAVVRDARTRGTYFVYVHRSDVDVLDGCWGPLVRPMIERRILREAPGILREVTTRLSRAAPP